MLAQIKTINLQIFEGKYKFLSKLCLTKLDSEGNYVTRPG